MIVLAIESTCDETGAAVARRLPMVEGSVNQGGVEILSDVKASSAEIHAKYGGVIPEIAAREQIAAIIPVIQEAIGQMANGPDGIIGINSWQMAVKQIDAIAVTQGPGLIGSLLIGVETAKTLSLAWNKPLIAVNHMAAHVFANYIVSNRTQELSPPAGGSRTQNLIVPELPAVALIVSGGHTDLMLLNSLTDWKWIGGTRDDAAGEAFDKAARAMGFPYPGGPSIANLAMEFTNHKPQITREMKLPRPMIHEKNLEMSFSGLKTAVVNLIDNGKLTMDNEENRSWLAREFNEAVVEVLVKKTMMAVEKFQPRSVLLAGGVAANALLRESLVASIKYLGKKLFIPELKYCTDNAAMIAACALLRPEYVDPLKLRPEPGLR